MVQLKKPSKKNQPRKPSQNRRVQNDLSKMAFCSSWIGGKKYHTKVFFTKIHGKKNHDFL
jgi:hypothetical protein